MKNEIRLLRADEIEVRVGQVSKGKASLLLYKDARCDMAILDEVFDGQWQRDHKELKGNLYAGVAFWDEDLMQWVWRWDCGTESNAEREKGEASDSFKRACVNIGIGRELYTAPPIWVDAETEQDGRSYKLVDKYQFGGCSVASIDYKDRAISALEITDRRGKVIFTYGKKTAPKPKKEEKPAPTQSASGSKISLNKANELRALAEKTDSKLLSICSAYKVTALEEMTESQYEDCRRKLEYKLNKKGEANGNQ